MEGKKLPPAHRRFPVWEKMKQFQKRAGFGMPQFINGLRIALGMVCVITGQWEMYRFSLFFKKTRQKTPYRLTKICGSGNAVRILLESWLKSAVSRF
jgi:hypothetical protein